MSYILDALRRAQADRERGQVPGLQAQPVADLSSVRAAGLAGSWKWSLSLAAGALVLAAALAWRWLAAGVPAVPVTVLAQPAAPQAAPPVAAPTAGVAPAAGLAQGRPLPVVVSAPATAQPGPPVATAAPTSPALTSPAPTTSAPTTPAPPTSSIREARLAQLPAELRRELPALAVGGTMWSQSAASRFLIIDGQVLREGEAAAPGVVLERIGQKSAWLRWREWRLELSF